MVALLVLTGGKCGKKPPKPLRLEAEEAVAQAVDAVDLEAELQAHGDFGVVVTVDDLDDERGWVVVYFRRDEMGHPEARVELDGEPFTVSLAPRGDTAVAIRRRLCDNMPQARPRSTLDSTWLVCIRHDDQTT